MSSLGDPSHISPENPRTWADEYIDPPDLEGFSAAVGAAFLAHRIERAMNAIAHPFDEPAGTADRLPDHPLAVIAAAGDVRASVLPGSALHRQAAYAIEHQDRWTAYEHREYWEAHLAAYPRPRGSSSADTAIVLRLVLALEDELDPASVLDAAGYQRSDSRWKRWMDEAARRHELNRTRLEAAKNGERAERGPPVLLPRVVPWREGVHGDVGLDEVRRRTLDNAVINIREPVMDHDLVTDAVHEVAKRMQAALALVAQRAKPPREACARSTVAGPIADVGLISDMTLRSP